MNTRILIIPIYYIILTICIGISSYLSYYGFLESLEELTLAFVAVIALGLFAAGSLLQLGRDKQSIAQQLLALMLFLIFAVFSTSSNFTRIYTQSMEDIVQKDAFQKEYKKFKETILKVSTALKSSIDEDSVYFERIAAGYKKDIDSDISDLKLGLKNSSFYLSQKQIADTIFEELKQMETQALDPERPGCGPKCREHAKTIDELVPTTDTVLPKGNNETQIKKTINNYRKKIFISFCSDAKFYAYHLLHSILEKLPNNYVCENANREFLNTFGSDELERLREKTKLQEELNIDNLETYLTKIDDVAKELQKIAKDIEALDNSYIGANFMQINFYPRKIADAVSTIENVEIRDIANISNRDELKKDLASKDYLTISIKATNKDYLLDEKLNEQDVIEEGTPLRFFLEATLAKQEEIISRYTESIPGAIEKENFSKIDPNNGAIGQIYQTLKIGLFQSKSIAITIYSLILGVSYDIIPIIFAFAAFHGYVKKPSTYDPIIRG